MSLPADNPYAPPEVDPIVPTGSAIEDFEDATRWERFWAALIDTVVSGVLTGLVGELWLALDVLPGFPQTEIHIVLFLLLNGWLLKRNGQTIGKLTMRTKIVSLNGTKAPLWRLLVLRYGVQWMFLYLPSPADGLLGLVDVLFIFRNDRRCAHDILAGTKVVKLGRPVPTMPKPRLMPHRNPAYAAHVLRGLLTRKLDVDPSRLTLETRWLDDLRIPAGVHADFCDAVAERFPNVTAAGCRKCSTYGELLELLSIPRDRRPL